MKKKTKIIAVILGIFIGLLVICSLALEYVLDLNSYKEQIVSPLEDALHRKVEIGNISHTLWRGPGGSLQDVTIFEQDRQAPFVKVEEIVAKIKLLPLLSGKIEISKVVINKPEIQISRDQQGNWNFGDLLSQPPAPVSTPAKQVTTTPETKETPPPAPAQTEQPAPKTSRPEKKQVSPLSQFSLNTFQLNDGAIRFVDRMTNLTTELNDITGKITGVALNTPIQLDLSADIDKGAHGAMNLAGQIGPLPPDGNLDNINLDIIATLKDLDIVHFSPYLQQDPADVKGLEKLDFSLQLTGNLGKELRSNGSISLGDLKAEISGKVQDVKTTPKIDLTISDPEIQWEKVMQTLPPELNRHLEILGLSGTGSLKIQPRGTVADLAITGKFDLTETGIQYQDVFAKPVATPATLTFDAALTPGTLTMSALKFMIGDMALTVAGNLTELQQPMLDLQITSNEFPLESVLALFPRIAKSTAESGQPMLTAKGTGTAQGTAKGTIQDLTLQLALNLDNGNIMYGNLLRKAAQTPGNLALEAKLSKDAVSVKHLALNLGTLQLTCAGEITNLADPQLDLNLTTNEFGTTALLKQFPVAKDSLPKKMELSGSGKLHLKVTGSSDNLEIAGEFDLTKTEMDYQPFFVKPETESAALTFQAALKPDTLDIASLKIKVGKFESEVSGTVSNFKKPTLDLQLASNEFPLKNLMMRFPRFSGKASQLKASGTGNMQAMVKGAQENLIVEATVNLDKSNLTYSNVVRKADQSPGNLKIKVQLGKDSVSIETFMVQLGDLQLTSSGKISNFAKPDVGLTIETNVFPIDKVLAQLPVIKTSLPADTTLSGVGKVHIVPAGKLDNLTVTGSVDFSKGEITIGKYFHKPKDLPGVLEFETHITEDAVDIRRLQLNINEVILDVKGTISDLKQDAMLDLALESNKFALNQLLLTPGKEIKPTGSTELNLTVKSPLSKIELDSALEGTLKVNDAGFTLPQLSKPVQHLNLLADIQDAKITIDNFSAAIGESSMQGTATIKQFLTSPDVVFTFRSPRLNLDEFMAQSHGSSKQKNKTALQPSEQSKPSKTAGESTSQSSARRPKPTFLQKINVAGDVKVDHGQAQDIRFSNLSMEVNMRQGLLEVENIFFDLYDGTYTGFVKLDLNESDPQYEFHSELTQVDTNKVLTDGTSLREVLYGLLFANLSLRGQGFETEQLSRTLTGDGSIRVNEGQLTTLDIWPVLAKTFQRLGELTKIKEFLHIGKELDKFPDGIKFSRLEGSFNLKRGDAGTSDLILELPEGDMHLALLLNGTFGVDTQLDFMGKIRFYPQSKYYGDIKKYFGDLKQAEGKIELPFPIPIGGTLLEPKFDTSRIIGSLPKIATELAKKAAKGKIEKTLTDGLQDLLEDKKKPAPESEQPAPDSQETQQSEPTPTPKPKPEDILKKEGKKLLKDLFK
jgi:uncharacterized protein involved in outer membrane biogenesis